MSTQIPLHAESDFLSALIDHAPVLVITGAGISVSTGIPTYRDEKGAWLRSNPITHQEFVADRRQRQRYWGRSLLGWPAVRDAKPAKGHRLLAQLEHHGLVSHIVTQNVDRLHQRAGSIRVTDLHGRLDRVRCLGCETLSSRDVLQKALERLNPHINHTTIEARPDGDADMPDAMVEGITVPSCDLCDGTLMPDVVFFGGSIPGSRVEQCKQVLEHSNSVLVVGSSLQVYSGYRFCKWAAKAGKPVFLMNPGQTRADDMATKWSVDADTGLDALLSLSSKKHAEALHIPPGHQPSHTA
ncbi:NAD-dependent protein deacetylase [Congregibacter litoralis]|uniref:protein acetyllysine N-acetyltransferase n=1 Tax=Congregibacter litoralis KT71 TaxID=314285 RepID=A4A8B4_9GAMM|nr:NAD-dependent protein deacetylase [Congregibacter litoralis]EAQ97909.1 NAD-dependent protein deacetylase, SIR2 family [Congregibacter litoralis KT71]